MYIDAKRMIELIEWISAKTFRSKYDRLANRKSEENDKRHHARWNAIISYITDITVGAINNK